MAISEEKNSHLFETSNFLDCTSSSNQSLGQQKLKLLMSEAPLSKPSFSLCLQVKKTPPQSP